MNQLRFIGFMEANSFALIILLIIYFNIRKYGSNKKFEQKIYSFLLFSNIAMLLVDLIRLYVDGKNDSVMYGINVVFTTIMIISTPLLPMLWTIYIDYKIFLDRVKLKRNFKYILIPSALNLLLAIVSLVGGINGKKIFSIDAENFYHRGDLYILMVLASYSYLIYSFVSLIKNKNLVDESEYKSLRMFAIPPFVGGILQSLSGISSSDRINDDASNESNYSQQTNNYPVQNNYPLQVNNYPSQAENYLSQINNNYPSQSNIYAPSPHFIEPY